MARSMFVLFGPAALAAVAAERYGVLVAADPAPVLGSSAGTASCVLGLSLGAGLAVLLVRGHQAQAASR